MKTSDQDFDLLDSNNMLVDFFVTLTSGCEYHGSAHVGVRSRSAAADAEGHADEAEVGGTHLMGEK